MSLICLDRVGRLLEARAAADGGHDQVKRGVLRMAALVGEIFRRLVLRPDLNQLRLLRMALPEVDAQTTLTGLNVLHGYLHRFIRMNRRTLSIVATSVPPAHQQAV
jgi:hypothetical protein